MDRLTRPATVLERPARFLPVADACFVLAPPERSSCYSLAPRSLRRHLP